MLRKLTLLICFGIFSSHLQASHLVGGEIIWTATPNGQYIFTLYLYRDCSGISLPQGTQTITGPGMNIACSPVPSLSGPVASNPNGSGCLLERGVYSSPPVSLNGVPPAAGWEFSWSSCCRPQMENTTATGFYLRSIMYPYTPPGSPSGLNVNTGYDSSPAFLTGFAFVASQGPYSINHQGVDRDQDSLAFSFGLALVGASSFANFDPGYSFVTPFPDATENPLNGPNFMDPVTGIIDIETYNAASGFYMNCIKVDSYRNGQRISTVYKELPLYIHGNSNSSINYPPTVFIDTAQYPGLVRNGDNYRITAMNGDSLNFDIHVYDADTLASGALQTFCLAATGVKINSTNLSSSINCLGGGPCATISNLPNGTYCDTNWGVYNFDWTAQCGLLSAGLLGRTTYLFHIYATDNDPSIPKSKFITLLVDLFPSQSSAPNLSISGGNTNGDVDLNWTPTNAPAAAPFGKYMIYANNGPGTAFSLRDSVLDRNSSTLSLSGLAFPAEFYINQITGSCRSASENSDTISSAFLGLESISTIGLSLYPQPAVNELHIDNRGRVKLEALRILNSGGALLKEIPLNANEGNWTIELNETPGLYFLEFITDQGLYREKLLIASRL